MAYIDRDSEEIKKMEISSTQGATSFIGAFIDSGGTYLYNANKIAYTPVESDPVNLPLVPEDAKKTDYKVTVIGNGYSCRFYGKSVRYTEKGTHQLIKKHCFRFSYTICFNYSSANKGRRRLEML